MQLVSLLGKPLKDDEIIEVLESLELEVVYDFDRSNEGLADKYWASSYEAGIQLRFDAQQRLDTIFLYIMPNDEFAAFDLEGCDIPTFASITQAREYAEAQGLLVVKGSANFFGVLSEWVRLEYDRFSVHYEFRACMCTMVTLMLSSVSPGRESRAK